MFIKSLEVEDNSMRPVFFRPGENGRNNFPLFLAWVNNNPLLKEFSQFTVYDILFHICETKMGSNHTNLRIRYGIKFNMVMGYSVQNKWIRSDLPDSFLTNLYGLEAGRGYLIKSTKDFVWDVIGQVKKIKIRWQPNAFYLTGFHRCSGELSSRNFKALGRIEVGYLGCLPPATQKQFFNKRSFSLRSRLGARNIAVSTLSSLPALKACFTHRT